MVIDMNFNMDFKVMEVLDVIVRSLLSLITLFLVTKMLGKKQVSQLSLFDYVIGISIGNFAAEMSVNLETNYINSTVAVIIFGLVAYLVSIITMKSIHLRRYFMGVPTILIEHGKLSATDVSITPHQDAQHVSQMYTRLSKNSFTRSICHTIIGKRSTFHRKNSQYFRKN